MKINKAAAIVLGLLFLAALGFVGSDDYADTVAEAVHYCDMVRAGYWPDYDGTAKMCPEVYDEARRVFGRAL